jgi:PAS domain S-box-containing protein
MSISQKVSEKLNQAYSQLTDPFVLNEILERISDAFIALDNNWCYTYMNKKAGEIFYRDPKTMIGKHIWTESPERIDQPFYKACHEAMEKQHYIHIEQYHPPHDLWFENHIYPSPEGLSIFIRNVTDKKKAEEAILKTKSQYQTLAEISPVGIFHTDAKGYTTYVNKRWCQISGLSFEQALGDGWYNAVHSDDKENLMKNWRDASKVGETSLSEYRFVRPDGTIAWVMGQARPRKNSDNQIVGYVGTTTDITERKKAEEEIAKIYKENETVLNRISDAVVSLDNEWRYTFLNDVALFTHPLGREGSIGKVIWDIHPEMKGTVFWEKYHEAMETKKTVEVESYYVPMQSWFSAKVYPSHDGLTIIYKDINERKKAEEALNETGYLLKA